MSDEEREDGIAIPGLIEESGPELFNRYRDPKGTPRPDLWRSGIDDLNKLSIAPGFVWTAVGPNPLNNFQDTVNFPFAFQGQPPIGGEVTDIAIDPSGADDAILYAATNNGGIWKSGNGGATWAATSDGMPSLSMGAVAIDPGNPAIIYAGSGNLFDGSSGFIKASGLYKSVDAGQTWFVADGGVFGTIFSGIGINRIVCPAADSLLVGTEKGLFRSVDGGMNFGANAPNFDDGKAIMNGFVSTLVMDTTDAHTVWVAIRGRDPALKPFSGGGLFQLTLNADGSIAGSDANVLNNPGGTAGVQFGSIAFAQSTQPDNTTLFASVQDQTGPDPFFVALYVSTNSGRTWTPLPNLKAGVSAPGFGGKPDDDQSSYDFTLGVDPRHANRVYAGFKQIWISENSSGALFRAVDPGQVHLDQHELVFSPQTHWGHLQPADATPVYVGTDGGVAQSLDGGVNWTQLNDGMGTHLFFGIDIGRGPGNNQFTYGGTQDNGTPGHRPGDANTTWVAGIDGDGGPPAVDPANPNIVYGFDDEFLIKTSDGGHNWAESNDGLGVAIANLTNSPIQVQAIGHLFQPGDKVTIEGVLTDTGANNPPGRPWDITVINKDNFRLEGSTGNGVYVAPLPPHPPDLARGRRIGRGLANSKLPDIGPVRRVALVPNGNDPAKIVYVTEQSDLRKSTDEGAHFTPAPVKKFDSLVFSMVCPDANGIWVGTEDGKVHFSPDGGSTWNDFSPGGTGPVTGIAVASDGVFSQVVVVYAGFSGINSKFRTGHCFLSTNGGNDWTDISGVDGRDTGNLPDLPLHSVVIDTSLLPLATKIIVATEGAVLQTGNDNFTWERLGTGLPRATCRSLAMDSTVPARTLRVGTYGRSCFELASQIGPHVAVEANLAFGGVLQGQTPTLRIRLFNVGDSPVSLSSFGRTAGDGDFEFAAPPNLADLTTNEIRDFDLKFTAAVNGVRTATFTLVSNDATHPSIQIAASGITFASGKPRLAVNANLNFGTIDRGASRVLAFTVANTGLADLVINRMDLSHGLFSGGGDFSRAAPAVPLPLAPAAQQSVNVTFSPGRWGGNSDAQLDISIQNSPVTRSIPLSGSSPFNKLLLIGVLALGVVAGGVLERDKIKKELGL